MTIPEFQRHKRDKKKLIVVTAYDALFTRIVEQAGIEAILVGDSLGVVVQGKSDTLSVTMEDMLYHTKLVAGAGQRALVIGDMPFMSYQASSEDALRNAGRFLQAGAQAIKVEGGAAVVDRVAAMTGIGIPVMGHLGMTPQSVHRYGGYKVQGKELDHAAALLKDAKDLEAAGAFAIVLEAIPTELAKRVTEQLTIPTIGIGAGPHCDGQVLVLYDLLGLFDDFVPKFVKPYAHLKTDALQALRRYKEEVESGAFPSDSESYH
ncbi:MAG: 3-methyl-2-oxobutanoate hydroxymethyltransferase [Nitrospira sp.]|jgi:3-methyl-2-oxobutanoate hydroxymethyltransferase|nr:3-methyl-2-oxobutanoate hydroxymethyltransferase [Nitrospira sp.]MBP0121892.1 3-methyl-2-oxobutanoate hydroxymethyltransferase [Nitrospira sp.]MBP0124513.1 3-methyl-2-oxobutanoate hydroxymethyltransferase [Nitrospira sp.]MBP0127913.1 3-methyl-2-oxobutanoate hydroxymethyltransferase [Nitrospira sp.]MBP0128319.1 3-methyl-2-oxobutanoate hydroxymethyltransferase [Nitrospira sp.]